MGDKVLGSVYKGVVMCRTGLVPGCKGSAILLLVCGHCNKWGGTLGCKVYFVVRLLQFECDVIPYSQVYSSLALSSVFLLYIASVLLFRIESVLSFLVPQRRLFFGGKWYWRK